MRCIAHWHYSECFFSSLDMSLPTTFTLWNCHSRSTNSLSFRSVSLSFSGTLFPGTFPPKSESSRNFSSLEFSFPGNDSVCKWWGQACEHCTSLFVSVNWRLLFMEVCHGNNFSPGLLSLIMNGINTKCCGCLYILITSDKFSQFNFIVITRNIVLVI